MQLLLLLLSFRAGEETWIGCGGTYELVVNGDKSDVLFFSASGRADVSQGIIRLTHPYGQVKSVPLHSAGLTPMYMLWVSAFLLKLDVCLSL